MGIMVDLSRLEAVFKEEFSQVRVQCCMVHVGRNVPVKIPRKRKKDVTADFLSISYAPSREAALEQIHTFKEKWGKDLPPTVMRRMNGFH